MRAKNRKGQVTIFIIIGIVLLFSTAIVLFIRDKVAEVKPPAVPELERIPSDLEPVRNFVTQCVEQTALDGLIKMGMQGGYIDASRFSANEINPTEGNAISLPDSAIKVPYWWYLGSSNSCSGDCRFESKRPSLNTMQTELAKYVSDNMGLCIAEFEDIKSQGFSVNILGPPTVKVEFGKLAVIDVQYPVEVSKTELNAKITRYFTTFDVDMPKIHNFASAITSSEVNNSYLEKQAMNSIAGFSGLDKSKLPPTAASEFKPGNPTTWIKTDVKSNLINVLTSYIPLLQVLNSFNFIPRIYDSDIRTGIYNTANIPIGTDAVDKANIYGDLSARFVYLDIWPPYFDIEGRGVTGELIGPESTGVPDLIAGIIGIHRYNLYYQLSFPVLVELSQPTALGGRGYSFRFAMEANVRNNDPMERSTVALQEAPEVGPLFCNADQKNSGEVRFSASTSDGRPVDGVEIDYACGEDSCLVGYAEISGNESLLREKLPICAGGYVVAKKSGYRTDPIRYDSLVGRSDDIPIVFEQIREKNVTIKKKKTIVTGTRQDSNRETHIWQYTGAESRLEPAESAVIIIEKIKESSLEEDFTQAMAFNVSNPRATIQLVPGKYRITGNLLLNKKVIVPKSKICVPNVYSALYNPLELFGVTEPTDCHDVDEIVFDTLPRGGVKLDETTSYWEIDASTLDDPKSLVVYVASTMEFNVVDDAGNTNPKLVHEDLEQLGKVEEYSRNYWQDLMPKLE